MPKQSPLKPRPTTAYVKFWIDDVAINFNLDLELRDALDRWKQDRLILTRTDAVKLMIDVVEPGTEKRSDRLLRYASKHQIPTWSGALRSAMHYVLTYHRGPAKWTAPAISGPSKSRASRRADLSAQP
jgi:hypothetical protein